MDDASMRVFISWGDTETGVEIQSPYHPELLRDAVARTVEAFISALKVTGQMVEAEAEEEATED